MGTGGVGALVAAHPLAHIVERGIVVAVRAQWVTLKVDPVKIALNHR